MAYKAQRDEASHTAMNDLAEQDQKTNTGYEL
jgi:hypothetical protein